MKFGHNYGETNPRAKLTAAQVHELRRLRPAAAKPKRYPKGHPLSIASLAKKFGIKPSQVSKICQGGGWGHL